MSGIRFASITLDRVPEAMTVDAGFRLDKYNENNWTISMRIDKEWYRMGKYTQDVALKVFAYIRRYPERARYAVRQLHFQASYDDIDLFVEAAMKWEGEKVLTTRKVTVEYIVTIPATGDEDFKAHVERYRPARSQQVAIKVEDADV